MGMSIDITAEQRKIVLSLLARFLPRSESWVYGSRARWTSGPKSDLDLVVFATPVQRHMVAALKTAFEESNLPFRVDLFVWDEIPEQFREQIEADHVVLVGSEEQEDARDWRTVGEFVPFTYGKSLPARNRNASGNVPVYGSNGVVGYHDVALTNGPTVIIGRKGTVGAIHYSSVPCWPIDTTFFVSGNEPDTQRFRYYALKSLGLEQMNSDSAVPGLNRDDAHARRLHVPPVTEQRAIAQILGTLDDKIELNQRMNETLAEMARALFKLWFVDFEPIRAKMEGRWQGGEATPGLTANLYNLFPDRLLDSELGEIPEGWEVKPLDEIATFLNGLALQKYRPDDGAKLPVIKIAQLKSGNTEGADWASTDIPPSYIVRDGDVLFSWSGSLELAVWTGGEGALNQHLFKVTSDHYPKWLYYCWILHHLNKFREIAADKTTTMGHIQRRHLKEALTVIPDTSLLEAMDLQVSPLFERAMELSLESRALATQRNTLLPQLVNGKIKVS